MRCSSAKPFDGGDDHVDAAIDIGSGRVVPERTAAAHRAPARAARPSRRARVTVPSLRSRRPTPPTRTRPLRRAGRATPRTRHRRCTRARHPATLSALGTVSTMPSSRACRPVDQPVAELGEPDQLGVPLRIGEFQRCGHRNDAGGVVRTAAALALLTATDDQRVDSGTAALDEHADALGSAELVGAQRQQIDVGGDRTQVEPTGRLHRVGVHERARCVTADDAGHRGEVVDGAHLVVDRHHTDHRSRTIAGRQLIERPGEVVEVDATCRVDTDDCTTMMLEPPRAPRDVRRPSTRRRRPCWSPRR